MKWSEQMRNLDSSDEYFKKGVVKLSDDNSKAYLYIDGKKVSESEITSDYASPSTKYRINFRFKDKVILDPVFLSNVMISYYGEEIDWYIKPYKVASSAAGGALIVFEFDDFTYAVYIY